jgi:hypothetical protein
MLSEEQLEELGDFEDFLEFLAFDPDQPRDERGRFASSGSREAASASGKAKRTGKGEHHDAAAAAHRKAEEFHAREADRRGALAAKARSKKDRERHLAAREKHLDAGSHHHEQAKVHEEHAGILRGSLDTLKIPHEGISPETKANAEKAIVKGGYAKFLKHAPISELAEHSGAEIDSFSGNLVQTANGLYWRGGEGLSILKSEDFETRFARSKGLLGKKKAARATEPGEHVWSISSLASSPEEMQQRTMVHELGHHVHLSSSSPLQKKLDNEIKKGFRERVHIDPSSITDKDPDGRVETVPGKWIPSRYSRKNYKEWFTECHAAYVYHPETLKARDPQAFDLIRRVRKHRGME